MLFEISKLPWLNFSDCSTNPYQARFRCPQQITWTCAFQSGIVEGKGIKMSRFDHGKMEHLHVKYKPIQTKTRITWRTRWWDTTTAAAYYTLCYVKFFLKAMGWFLKSRSTEKHEVMGPKVIGLDFCGFFPLWCLTVIF